MSKSMEPHWIDPVIEHAGPDAEAIAKAIAADTRILAAIQAGIDEYGEIPDDAEAYPGLGECVSRHIRKALKLGSER